MDISNKLDEVRTTLEQAKRNRKFKKANADRKAAAELQYTQGQCRGKLEVCKNELQRTIKAQSRNIQDGKLKHQDTILQEQILWDAAIGYMLVKDAIYALSTINNYDSVAHAYDLLDAAMKQMSGKKKGLSDFVRIKSTKERNEYGYVTSSAAVKNKEGLLNGVFEKLKETGNIEECLKNAEYPEELEAARRHDAPAGQKAESLSQMVDDLPDDEEPEELDDSILDSMGDIHPPKV